MHFPANILALRTIHKYESIEVEDDYDYFMEEDDDDDEDDDISEWPRNYPITSEETPEPCSASREPSSAVERKVKKTSRRAKLEGPLHTGGEWLAVLDSKEDSGEGSDGAVPDV